MPVIMTLTSANAAIQILASAMKALNAAREHSRASKDTDLKADINTLYDELLALKEAVIRVTDENLELRNAFAQQQARQAEAPPPKPELRQAGAVNHYYVGATGPYCQPCYDGKGKLTALSPPQDWNDGIRRRCSLCKEFFYEKPMDEGTAFGSVRVGRG
jgi:hypothetical protein